MSVKFVYHSWERKIAKSLFFANEKNGIFIFPHPCKVSSSGHRPNARPQVLFPELGDCGREGKEEKQPHITLSLTEFADPWRGFWIPCCLPGILPAISFLQPENIDHGSTCLCRLLLSVWPEPQATDLCSLEHLSPPVSLPPEAMEKGTVYSKGKDRCKRVAGKTAADMCGMT